MRALRGTQLFDTRRQQSLPSANYTGIAKALFPRIQAQWPALASKYSRGFCGKLGIK
jgi:hypothetical protein